MNINDLTAKMLGPLTDFDVVFPITLGLALFFFGMILENKYDLIPSNSKAVEPVEEECRAPPPEMSALEEVIVFSTRPDRLNL